MDDNIPLNSRTHHESDIFNNIDDLIKSPEKLKRLLAEKKERLKELEAINQTSRILKENTHIDVMLQQICSILPRAWQYPSHTVARIKYGTEEYSSLGFEETQWRQIKTFETVNNKQGVIEIFYTKEFPLLDEGPFLKEERELINNLASIISGYLNTLIGKNYIKSLDLSSSKKEISVEESASMKLLQKFLRKHNSDRDIYHDLMPHKVREILLVANLYDAYSIEKEGRFFEQVSGEYYQLNLSSAPRVTGVSTPDEALEKLQFKHYDLVIVMMGVDKKTPIELGQIIKQIYPSIPIFLLLNNNSDIALFEDGSKKITYIDKIFVWNGDSKVFLAMVKYLEDMLNVENDVEIGLTRVILLVEDSAKYYSRYLPILYSIIIEQTQRLIDDINTNDELYKLLRMRVRPKVLLASNFEEAVYLFNKFRENILCVISDVKFEKKDIICERAGLEFIKYVKSQINDLPTLLQSSDLENASEAYQLQTTFINKNSDTLKEDLKSFISYYLGFGNFVYKDEDGRREIATASNMLEFEKLLKVIPDKSLEYHARRNHFSNWIMARGEIQLAKRIKPVKVTDFKNNQELREYMLTTIQTYRNEKNKGKVVNFDETALLDETTIVSLVPGALGGKGRGLSFISTLIHNFNFSEILPNIKIRTPRTSIIGTEEFEIFMERNSLREKVYYENDYQIIKELFVKSELSSSLIRKLKRYLLIIDRPLAVRSSSLFEDSLMQPFAGIFDTYLLPNNDEDFNARLEQLSNAIKLVFASIFSPTARGYFQAVNYKIEEEKMAVIIQEVVGNRFENSFYPHISGVAQSYNFYPFSHMKPEEGFAVMAVGLGKYVVEGEKTYRFSPKYPGLEINSPKDCLKNSQVYFFGVDMSKKKINLLEGEDAGLVTLDIYEAEKHGTLKHCASVYDADNERIVPGLTHQGPRIINFANILKYEYIPLAKTIQIVLDVVKEAMGSPVEIEFAVDLNMDKNYRASFYLLQIKPLIGKAKDFEVNPDKLDRNKMILFTEKGMGNGKINNVCDILYVKLDAFDKTKTLEIAEEISKINAQMIVENKKYVLIGPGRWGTRDRFIGIPVSWPQISNAKVIVETSQEDFPLDASLGSHFFHNVTSMNVGYFSVLHTSQKDFIDWDKINNIKGNDIGKYFRHISLDKPLEILMDGKKRIAVITL
ncbi:MAG: PEP/pyruvate-binding domain-containing protein [Bacteroidales bacterium]|nr:PEP/pyruvate-binding domain-containing protein [Bacteroidales bacterium]